MRKGAVVKLLTALVVMCALIALVCAWAPSNEASRALFSTSLTLFGSGVTTLFVVLTARW